MELREASAKYLLEAAPQATKDEVPPGYKRTEVGVIPEDWQALPLGDIITLQRGFDLPHRLREQGFVPIVTSSGIEATHSKAKVEGPGVVTGRYGTIGGVYFVTGDFWPLNTTLYVKAFFGNDPLFISYLLRTLDFHDYSGKSGVPGVNRNDLHTALMPFPPTKTEQRTIATALSDTDALITALQQLIDKKRAIKQGAMQGLLTGRQRLPGFDGKWNAKPMSELFRFSGNVSASRAQLGSKGLCYLHYGDIHTSTKTILDVDVEFSAIPKLDIPLGQLNRNSLLEDGDVVFVDASEDEDGVSRHIVIKNPNERPFISGLHTIAAKPKTDLLIPEYCRYCFQTQDVKAQFLFFAAGTKVLGINKGNIGKIEIFVPDRDEQTGIATVLSDMDAEITALEARLAKNRALKAGMMQQLLTGRIRLTGADHATDQAC